MDRVERHPPGAGSEHGTRARYVQAKCRCAECRAANTRYYRDRQKRLDELRPTVLPSGPPGEGTLLRRGRPVKVKTCPGAGGKPCVRAPASWLRGQGDVCGACVERATVWNGNVDPTEAREHLLRLRREGVGYKSVHDASDVPSSTLARVLAGEGTIRAGTLKRILEVDAGAIADHAVAPKKAVRRMKRQLDELVALGFRKHHLARLLGSNSQALQVGRTGGALASSVAAVDKLRRRVERGEVAPEQAHVDSGPAVAALRELLEEEWIAPDALWGRLGFRVDLEKPRPRMRRARAEAIASLAAELRRERDARDEEAEREHDRLRFGLARNASDAA